MFDTERETRLSLERLLPRLHQILTDADDALFHVRLQTHFPALFRLLLKLYGTHYDFFYHLERIIITAAEAFKLRPDDLRALDEARLREPYWYNSHTAVGGVLYVDLFNGTLAGVREKIPYLKQLGLTYLHLMPLFECPADNSDGGYAISSFRAVNPALGTMGELRQLATELRAEGISLVLDFVLNHTSNEHEWAKRALAGEERYQNFYHIFPDRTLPDQYQPMLRDIFPEQAPGAFTYLPAIDKWVWTTFNTFQWDLNYKNPELFTAMLGEMLYLANQGVEVLRLDAVAFMWKQLGTTCENLPQVHTILQAFNAVAGIASPALIFKSEAIVHPDDVASYISPSEAQISYNPTFMALLWEALATREVKLLRHAMQKRFALPEGTAWVNYIRVHDDIGWSFADEDALELGINGFDHRQFLSRFYTGQYEGSFAAGVPFNFNPQTLDSRICGTAASLAGLEAGIKRADAAWIDAGIKRILLMYGVILAAGGIPLLYIGDEIAQLNDYGYKDNPNKASDSRWVHRPKFNWERLAEAEADPASPHGRVYNLLLDMIAVRKTTPALADGTTVFFDTGSAHVLGFVRNGKVMVLANFSDYPQVVTWEAIAPAWDVPAHAIDLITNEPVLTDLSLVMPGHGIVWLAST
jgi:amylosucrase